MLTKIKITLLLYYVPLLKNVYVGYKAFAYFPPQFISRHLSFFIDFYRSIVALQCCVRFCWTAK